MYGKNSYKQEDNNEKKLVILCIAAAMSVSMLGGCGNSAKTTDSTKTEDTTKDSDQAAADKVAKLIDDIYVQEKNRQNRQTSSVKRLKRPGMH